jgi:clusterin-associated protein 1
LSEIREPITLPIFIFLRHALLNIFHFFGACASSHSTSGCRDQQVRLITHAPLPSNDNVKQSTSEKMSYKDVQVFTEHLKLLGYPKNVPMAILGSNFGGPESFKAYADILKWLIDRLEPGAVKFHDRVNTEADRVLFIRMAVECLATKAGIKVNPRKLYASSAAAATEMLKITNVLVKTSTEVKEDDEVEQPFHAVDLSDKIESLRKIREMSSELTVRGAELFDLLAKEHVNKNVRYQQSVRPLEISQVESTLKQSIDQLDTNLSEAKQKLEAVQSDKTNLVAKLQRKTNELERSVQRLQTLQKIRPQYLEEFEQLESELRTLHGQYFVRARCIEAIKAQINVRHNNAQSQSDSMTIKTRENSMTILPDGLLDSDDEDEEEEDDGEDSSKPKIGQAAPATKRVATSKRLGLKMARNPDTFGSMSGLMNDSSTGDDSDSDGLDFGGDGLDDLGSDDADQRPPMKHKAVASRNAKPDQSDEDF